MPKKGPQIGRADEFLHLQNHPDFRNLFVTKDEDGEDTNFLLTSPLSPALTILRKKSRSVLLPTERDN